MIKDPVVPLSPSLLPQQRLYEVKTLPEWPNGVRPRLGRRHLGRVDNPRGTYPRARSSGVRANERLKLSSFVLSWGFMKPGASERSADFCPPVSDLLAAT